MKALSQNVRKALIVAIQDSESHREQLDLSRFLSLGVTEEQIYLIDHSISMLREHPYLRLKDFAANYSMRQIEQTLGDIDSFKKLLKLDEFTYLDWLTVNNLADDEFVCLPYLIYQHFCAEIRESYVQGAHLNENLKVDLGCKQVDCLTFRCGTQLGIPANEYEMMIMLLLSRYGYYTYFKLNDDDMVLTLKSHTKVVSVELKIYASHFSKQADYHVCLIDDRNKTQRKNSPQNVVKLEQFSLRHHSNFNAGILNAAGLL